MGGGYSSFSFEFTVEGFAKENGFINATQVPEGPQKATLLKQRILYKISPIL